MALIVKKFFSRGTMKSRGFLLLAFFSLALTLPGCRKGAEERLPNIILITVDALRADHLGTYGYGSDVSPRLDALAGRSTVYEFAYCPIPKTSASLASMMTGLHPLVHKTRPNRGVLAADHITLAEALKMRGYTTRAVVDNASLSRKFKFHQGFEDYIEVWNHVEEKTDSTAFITDRVLEWLEAGPAQPFFLWVHYIEPHSPYRPPSEFIENRSGGRILEELQKAVIVYPQKYRPAGADEGYFHSLYEASVKYTDREIGRIIDLFDGRGYDKNTILIITSDHGEELGEYNFFYNHGPLPFNSSVRIPLIVYEPGVRSRRIRYPVSLMDLYPTLLDRAGLVSARSIQGRELTERNPERKLYILAICDDNRTYSVVYRRFHYVRLEPGIAAELGLEEEYLFNIHLDPLERNNLIKQERSLADLLVNDFRLVQAQSVLAEDSREKGPELSENEIRNLKSLGYIKDP